MYAKQGILPATGYFVAAVLFTLPFAWRLERKVPVMPLIAAGFVGFFGGLTLLLGDSTFIKLKPTAVSLFFALVLLGGLARGKLFLASLLGAGLRMEERGWRILTVRFASFFLVLAVTNEIVWRTLPEPTWVKFKVFGILPLTFLFMIFQVGVMKRYELKDEADEEVGEA